MKIVEEYNDTRIELIAVKKADYLGDFAVGVSFTDGSYQAVSFKSFLENSLHPSIRKYLSEKLFKEFRIVDGNLNWNDYDLIFPIEDLYVGKIS